MLQIPLRDALEVSADPGPADPAAPAYLYAATCSALRSWSADLGFDVAHIGIASDPLHRIAGLRASGHAALSYFLRPYENDFSFGDWQLMPLDLETAAVPMPDGCCAWGGAVRAALPAGATPEELAERLSVLLRPLEAHRCAQLPEAVEGRAAMEKFLPVLPRYTVRPWGTFLVQDLYRLSGGDDVGFLAEALGTSLAMLGADRPAFDRMLETMRRAPSAHEGGYAAYPPAPQTACQP